MEENDSPEEKLKQSLKTILHQQDLSSQQDLINRLTIELNVSLLDCAAALTLLNQPEFLPKNNKEYPSTKSTNNKTVELSQLITKHKVVRYRFDIGRKHQLSLEQLKNVLVEVSGVERKSIGWIDIRNYYTLVELPDGMPADIFQLLSEFEINNQKLSLKRIKTQRKFYRKKSKKKSYQNSNKE